MNSHYKYTSIPKSSFYKINILILPINTEEKYLKSVIMNLIFRTVWLENLMTSCREKLYHHTISNKIKSNFLIILFGKMSSSKSLPSSSTESKIERMTDRLVTILLNQQKKKFQFLMAGILWVIWPAAMMQLQMVWMIELVTKPGANVNAVLRWKLA